MIKRFALLLGLLWGNGSVFCQRLIISNVSQPSHNWLMKVNPLSIFEIDGGISISGEYVVARPRIGLQLEVQPILFSIWRDDVDAVTGQLEAAAPFGIKLRPEARYYFSSLDDDAVYGQSRYRKHGAGSGYIGVDFLYKYMQREKLANFTISNGAAGTGYRQQAVFADVKQVIGGDIKIGFLTPLSDDRHWWIDVFFGFGGRVKWYSYRRIPDGASQPRHSVLGLPRTINTGDRVGGISIPFAVKIAYRF